MDEKMQLDGWTDRMVSSSVLLVFLRIAWGWIQPWLTDEPCG